MRLLALAGIAASALTASCSLANPLQSATSVWAINESSNHYVVRVGGDEMWDLPPHAGGFVADGGTLEILDADNCVVVATESPTNDVLVNVDAQGRVDFVPQYEQPSLGDLQPTTSCGVQPTDIRIT